MSLQSEIERALATSAPACGPFARRWTYFDEVGSTNDLALRAAEQGAPDGTLFVAGAQTAGRGRLGRVWHSPPESGLYVSTIVRRPALTPWLTLAGGVAVSRGVRAATGLPVQLKWPNDVVVVSGTAFRERRKLAGILAEASTDASGVQYVVLGFGVNLRSTAFPPELSGIAASIEGELGRPIDGGAVLAAILASLHECTAAVEANGPAPLLAAWLDLAPSAHGTAVEWDGPDGVRSGTSAGVGPDGALLVRTAHGVERIISGEVRWR